MKDQDSHRANTVVNKIEFSEMSNSQDIYCVLKKGEILESVSKFLKKIGKVDEANQVLQLLLDSCTFS